MLRDYITIYLNDVLVYLNKSRKDYIKKVYKKYIFVVKEIKYLRYIIEVKVYIYLNPKKIKAICK
ncbi:uncharacterized protein THITE_2054992 [Thermothielavioides terrestris NRRL 8126]|uniref:Uncharacterized protein n=1 Tax=Thermothielavioides terrestris (strain ATCC 38088 / NRRL 8126) TaxID=578455 RepID=G2RBY4_THETT|nr:uncharacterized protein THITE_2054992 [Thermothielavioides terrestris NRRL 8126]AEO69305.1 hypothetical protein THITE_2054992 [Thermothielavioides terrestris NRRL 8126]